MTIESHHISGITLRHSRGGTRNAQVEQEREVAICDLLDKNYFRLEASTGGPYQVTLGVEENRLVLDVAPENSAAHDRVMLSLSPFRGVIRDYFLVCENYFKAIRNLPPHIVETLDMGRRALHDEGSAQLKKRLEGKIETDFATARRLFTLICVMHLKGWA